MADRWDSFTESFVRLGARYRLQRGATTFALTPWAGRDVLSFEEYAESSERGNESELSRTSWPVGLRASVTHDRRWGHVDVQNATWRDNVEDIAWDDDRRRETRTTGLPIIPMIGVEYVPRP